MAKKPATNPELSPTDSQSPSTAMPMLSDYLASLGTARPRVTVRVYRVLNTGRWSALDTFTGDKCDEFVIGRKYGGGDYTAQVIDPSNGRVLKTMKVEVDPQVAPEVNIVEGPQLGATPAASTELAELRALVKELVTARVAPASPAIDLQGIAALMTAMQGSALKATDLLAMVQSQQRQPIGELLDAVERMAELRGLSDGPSAADTGEEPAAADPAEVLIREGISLAREFLALRAQRKPAPRQAPKPVRNQASAAVPAATRPTTAVVRLAAMLQGQAVAELDVDLAAQSVAAFIGTNGEELVGTFDMSTPMAPQLIERMPSLKTHEAYLAAVESRLREMAAEHTSDDEDEDDAEAGGAAGSEDGEAGGAGKGGHA